MNKKITLFISILFLLINSITAQEQDVDAPFYYQVSGLIYVYDYNVADREQASSFKIPKPPLKFEIVRKEKNSDENYEYYILKFLSITKDAITVGGKSVSIKDDKQFINSEDNSKYYWIRQDELDNLLDEKTIIKSYKLTKKPAYGASVSLPFKLRPKVGEQNTRLTPDLTLGGYLGLRTRISRKEPFYVTAPLITIGLSTLPISSETDGTVPDKGDGMVLGTTISTGAIFQFRDFQFGFLLGWDHATGELGKSWLYNNRPWYSFSIGFSFLSNRKEPDEKK